MYSCKNQRHHCQPAVEFRVAMVEAVPNQFTEIARIPAVDGKTWNHPVLVGDILLVCNAREMAAFRLALADL
jgi:outer membrane protein assembly factor BamB